MTSTAGTESRVLAEAQARGASGVLPEALRRAAIPSLAGALFEAMGLAWVLGAIAALTILGIAAGDTAVVSTAIGSGLAVPQGPVAILSFVLAAPLILAATRVAAGLARIAAPGGAEGPRPTLMASWRAGSDVQVSAVGVWFQVFGMMASGTLCLLGPLVLLTAVVGADALGPFSVILSGLALTLTLVYGAELGALQELAMASVVRHRRGVGSAVLHAWRMMRQHPGVGRRLAAGEFAVRFVSVAVAVAVGRSAGAAWGVAFYLLVGALVGAVRAHAWSVAYPRLGGLEAARRAGGEG